MVHDREDMAIEDSQQIVNTLYDGDFSKFVIELEQLLASRQRWDKSFEIRFDSIRTRGPAHLITLNYTLLFMENYKSNCTRLHWGGTPGKIGDHLTLNYT